jgi:hypothetical protein
MTPTKPSHDKRFASELDSLEREARIVTAASRMVREVAKRSPEIVDSDDVALARESARDVGRARVVLEGLGRRWGLVGGAK